MKKIFLGIIFFIFIITGCSNHISPSPVVEAQNYRIYSIIPSEAKAGDTVTIVGEYFDQYALVSLSSPNGGPMSGVNISPTLITDNRITFIVPATNGSVTPGYSNSTLGINYVQVFGTEGSIGGVLTTNTIILNVIP